MVLVVPWERKRKRKRKRKRERAQSPVSCSRPKPAQCKSSRASSSLADPAGRESVFTYISLHWSAVELQAMLQSLVLYIRIRWLWYRIFLHLQTATDSQMAKIPLQRFTSDDKRPSCPSTIVHSSTRLLPLLPAFSPHYLLSFLVDPAVSLWQSRNGCGYRRSLWIHPPVVLIYSITRPCISSTILRIYNNCLDQLP